MVTLSLSPATMFATLSTLRVYFSLAPPLPPPVAQLLIPVTTLVAVEETVISLVALPASPLAVVSSETTNFKEHPAGAVSDPPQLAVKALVVPLATNDVYLA